MANKNAATAAIEVEAVDLTKVTPKQLKAQIGDNPEARDRVIHQLLELLKTFGKGARASAEAKKIRRNLRSLGFYISKTNA